MRWPFKSNKETDIRVFRDPKTDEITLRVAGPLSLPSSENPIITMYTTVDYALNTEAVQRLHEQLSYFAKQEVEAERQ
jgi:hypothetical protein